MLSTWFPVLNPYSQKTISKKYSFELGDYNTIACSLNSTDWDCLFSRLTDVNSIWSAFKVVLCTHIDQYIPSYKISSSKKKVYPLHIKRRLTEKKMTWHDRFKPGGGEQYKKIFVTCRSLISRFHKRKENMLIKNENVKKFYNYVNNKLKDKCKIAPIKRTDESFIQSDEEKCNMLNTFFTSVFTTDYGLNPFPDFIFARQPDVNLDFSPANISKIIHNMNKNSCAGPDGIPALFWNKLSFCLSYPLSMIFSTSFSTAILPAD